MAKQTTTMIVKDIKDPAKDRTYGIGLRKTKSNLLRKEIKLSKGLMRSMWFRRLKKHSFLILKTTFPTKRRLRKSRRSPKSLFKNQ